MKSKLKYGGMSLTLTIVFLAGFVLLNVLCSLVTDRFYLKADLTATGVYNLTEDTQTLLRDMGEPVELTVLFDEYSFANLDGGPLNEILNNVQELIAKYAALSGGKLTVRYLDPDTNPQLSAEYEQVTLQQRGILLESSQRYTQISPTDYFEVQQGVSGAETSLKFEQTLSNALLYVLNETIPKAVFVSGHGEYDSGNLQSSLKNAGYDVSTINIESEEIPADTSLLVLFAPSSDFSESGIGRLDAYFATGGDGMYLYIPGQALPRLDQYWTEWGFSFEPYIVIEPERSNPQDPLTIYPVVLDHPVNSMVLDTSSPYIATRLLTPIKLEFDTKNSRKTEALLSSTGEAYARHFTSETQTLAKSEGDIEGPFTLAVLSTGYYTDAAGDSGTQHVMATGVNMFAGFDAAFGNAKFLSGALSYMNPAVKPLSIASRKLSSVALNINAGQSIVIFWILVIVLPLGILALGIAVWRRRKRL